MPRIEEETSTLLAELTGRFERLVAAARQEGRDAALGEVRSLVGGAAPANVVVRRGPGRPKGSTSDPKSDALAPDKQKRRNSWDGLSAEARLARVNAVRKGKGLPPEG